MYQNAFDTLDHRVLLEEDKEGFSFYWCFFSGRNNERRVTEKTILGPLLFLLYSKISL